ncbi:unnamed protein product, partial [Hapterophycus canaliculatus]
RFQYFFVSGATHVPKILLNLDIVTACLQHIGKLALVTLRIMDEFPYDCCPRRACTPEGANYLGLELADFLEILGFPPEWIVGVEGMKNEDGFRVIGKQIDAVDTSSILRLSKYADLVNQQR